MGPLALLRRQFYVHVGVGGWESLDYIKSWHAIQDFENRRQKETRLREKQNNLKYHCSLFQNWVSPLPEGSNILDLIMLPYCHKSPPHKNASNFTIVLFLLTTGDFKP